MTVKEQFVFDVINRYKVVGSAKKLDPLTLAIIMAILTEALKYISANCLSNLFEKYFINRALKKASKVVEDNYSSVYDFYELYCDDDLVESIISVKRHLTVQETKDLLGV